jgi:hypothetical protein
MLARSMVGLSGGVVVVALVLFADGPTPATHVVAGGPRQERARSRPNEASSSRVLQGDVLAVGADGRQLEAAIALQWAPEVSAVAQREVFATDGRTRLNPAGGGVASLRPGDPVQIVAVPHAGEGWRAVEVTKIDLD